MAHLLNVDQKHPITVEGNTDNVPIASAQYPSNWELSTARATSVVRYLIAHGVTAQRLGAAGYADLHPARDQHHRRRTRPQPARRHRPPAPVPRPAADLNAMTKKKLIIILVVVLAGGGFAAKTFLLPKPKPWPSRRSPATIYVLPKRFTFNLTDGRYATMTAGLVLASGSERRLLADGGDRLRLAAWARCRRRR